MLLALALLSAPDVDFTVGHVAYRSTLAETDEGGMLWVRPMGTESKAKDFLVFFDDFAFEPMRHQSFALEGSPSKRMLLVEHYESNWAYAVFYIVTADGVKEAMSFGHRDPSTLSFSVDQKGLLREVRFRDRWVGRSFRPKAYQNETPGMRWENDMRFRPTADGTWKLAESRWQSYRFGT